MPGRKLKPPANTDDAEQSRGYGDSELNMLSPRRVD